MSTAPRSALGVLLCLLPLHLVVEVEARALACWLSGVGMWLGRGSDIRYAQICAWQVQLDPVCEMDQDKMKSRIVLGTPFKVEILLCKRWLSILPMTVQSEG